MKEPAYGMAREGMRKSTTHKCNTKPILANTGHSKKSQIQEAIGGKINNQGPGECGFVAGTKTSYKLSLCRVVNNLGEPGVDLGYRNISAHFKITMFKKLYDFAPVLIFFAKQSKTEILAEKIRQSKQW